MLVVEGDVEGGGVAVVPCGPVYGEVEEDEALGGFAGVDLGFAVEGSFDFFFGEGF